MTKKEKKQIEGVLVFAMIANGRGADPREMFVALANDIHRIKCGEEATEMTKLWKTN
tara:strand:+ start:188 stop:358 length:171 start_codon:yes stop_codon:yes gene_type:complete